MMRMRWTTAALCVLLAAPAAASAQDVRQSRLGLTPAVAPRTDVGPHVTAAHRRAGWEVGALFGGIGGAFFGYGLVVHYDDGRAEKMGGARKALTILGSAAIGAGIGALIQSIID